MFFADEAATSAAARARPVQVPFVPTIEIVTGGATLRVPAAVVLVVRARATNTPPSTGRSARGPETTASSHEMLPPTLNLPRSHLRSSVLARFPALGPASIKCRVRPPGVDDRSRRWPAAPRGSSSKRSRAKRWPVPRAPHGDDRRARALQASLDPASADRPVSSAGVLVARQSRLWRRREKSRSSSRQVNSARRESTRRPGQTKQARPGPLGPLGKAPPLVPEIRRAERAGLARRPSVRGGNRPRQHAGRRPTRWMQLRGSHPRGEALFATQPSPIAPPREPGLMAAAGGDARRGPPQRRRAFKHSTCHEALLLD